MIYLCNTFSVHMLPHTCVGDLCDFRIQRVSAMETGRILRECDYISCFGHARSAWHLSRYLRVDIPVDRGTIRLTEDDVLIVAAVSDRKRWETGQQGCPSWVFYRVTLTGRDLCRYGSSEPCL